MYKCNLEMDLFSRNTYVSLQKLYYCPLLSEEHPRYFLKYILILQESPEASLQLQVHYVRCQAVPMLKNLFKSRWQVV